MEKSKQHRLNEIDDFIATLVLSRSLKRSRAKMINDATLARDFLPKENEITYRIRQ
jgi:hypothetical protein